MTHVDKLKERNILIIEQDKERLTGLQNMLSAAGYRRLLCASEQDLVFELIRPFQGKVDEIGAIILNYQLPQSDTLKLCELLTTLDGHDAIPLIFVTPSNAPYLVNKN